MGIERRVEAHLPEGLRVVLAVFLLSMAFRAAAFAQHNSPATCQKLTLAGEASAGHEWRQEIGAGWMLRMVPIASGYSGWDLVVDREPGAGYPDALLLATPPYGSINEREIGTTFGLRAQDAIGWNPRSFHFLTDEKSLHEAQKLYAQVAGPDAARRPQASQQAVGRLMELAKHAPYGQLRIEDAKLASGVGDAPAFAEGWTRRGTRIPHTEVSPSGGRSTARGELLWMRFTITLWLAPDWKPAKGIAASRGACQE